MQRFLPELGCDLLIENIQVSSLNDAFGVTNRIDAKH